MASAIDVPGARALVDDIDCSHGNGEAAAVAQFAIDQKFCSYDYDYSCGTLLGNLTTDIVYADNPKFEHSIGSASPGCVYWQPTVFTNDLPYSITVTYSGYKAWGPETVPPNCPVIGSNTAPPSAGCSIAPFIAGALDDWADYEGMTLAPGESTGTFYAYVGMPWFIGNEAQGTAGYFEFDWSMTRVGGESAPTIESDLSIVQNVDLATVYIGNTVVYTTTVTNNGPDIAENVIADHILPPWVQYVSSSPSVGVFDSNTGEWSIGQLAVGETVTLAVVATVTNPGDIPNTANVRSDSYDPNPSDDYSSNMISVLAVPDVPSTGARERAADNVVPGYLNAILLAAIGVGSVALCFIRKKSYYKK